jgi:hypothetical protein
MYWVGTDSDIENIGGVKQFHNVSNETESYLSFSTGDRDSWWALASDGQLQDYGEKILMESGKCFGYSSDGGCVEQNVPNCRNSSQTFEKRNGYFVPVLYVDYNSSISIGDCWARCKSNCSCFGF